MPAGAPSSESSVARLGVPVVQRNTEVSGPTKTSPETSAVAGVCAALATALAADRATAAQPDVVP